MTLERAIHGGTSSVPFFLLETIRSILTDDGRSASKLV